MSKKRKVKKRRKPDAIDEIVMRLLPREVRRAMRKHEVRPRDIARMHNALVRKVMVRKGFAFINAATRVWIELESRRLGIKT